MSRKAGDKRQQILAAATKIFADQGFHQARIADIAAAAGVGKGTIYEYFPGKKELFQQLLVHIFTTYLDNLQRVCQDEKKLTGFLRRLVAESLGYFHVHQEIARILLNDHPPVDAATQRLLCQIQQEKLHCLGKWLQAAVDQGEMRPVNPHLAAVMVTGCIAAVGHQLFNDPASTDLPALAEAVIDLLLRGLQGGKG
ncbi:TetR/AcrR family transcriptional regulator [Moorella naiadis]|uniref:TetR/AcrR family transcriptional regulator n=1 Tax=Moorella naiadis (nom. illeg.) TaxID=3093670 RepID=UPI003D9C8C12